MLEPQRPSGRQQFKAVIDAKPALFWASIILTLIPVILFLWIALPQLDRPGLHYDEVLEASLPAAQLLAGQPITALNGVALHIGGIAFPLMVQNHIGASQVYASLPFIWLGGSTAFSLRIMTLLAGLLMLLSVYAFMAQIYGRVAALVSSVWLASFATFVFWSRQGAFVTNLSPAFICCALALGVAWWNNPRKWLLFLVGFCTGFAIYSKVSATWIVLALIVWGIISANRKLPAIIRTWLTTRWQELLIFIAGGFVAGWPLLLYNIRSGWATWRVVAESADQSYLGVSNADVWNNFLIRLQQAVDIIRSGDHLWYLGGSYPKDMPLYVVLGSLAIIIIAVIAQRGAQWRSRLMLPVIALLMILQSCYTISSLWHTHFAIGMMFPAMFVGLAISILMQWWGTSKHAITTLCFGLSLLAIGYGINEQIESSLDYREAAVRTGGLSYHSAAIYDLAAALKETDQPLVALDWGISTVVEYLDGAKRPVKELYGYTPEAPADFAEQLAPYIDQGALFITHAENQEAFPRRAAFLQVVADAGLQANTINVSVDSNGWPLFEVWQIEQP